MKCPLCSSGQVRYIQDVAEVWKVRDVERVGDSHEIDFIEMEDSTVLKHHGFRCFGCNKDFTVKQYLDHRDRRHGWVEGEAQLDPVDILSQNDDAFEAFLDALSDGLKLPGGKTLTQIEYRPIRVNNGEIVYLVSGYLED
jgi:hypothetical protein